VAGLVIREIPVNVATNACPNPLFVVEEKMTFRSLFLIALFAATSALSTCTARAGLVLLDNTSGLTSWNSSSSSNFSGNYEANAKILGMTFVTGSASYDIDSVSVAMAYGNGSLTPTMRLSVFENGSTSNTAPADGATATYFQDFSGSTFNSTQQIYTFSPSATWNLKANTSYSVWLGTSETNFTNNAALRWYQASAAASSTLGFAQTGGFYSTNGGASYSAGSSLSMQLTGTAAAAVPELDPTGIGSVLALIAGVLGILERRRTRLS
jgi:hypothetical protein